MKLYLVIAVVICMRVAEASLTFEVVEHGQLVTDAARSGTSLIRNLRSNVATGFAEELEEAFVNHAKKHFTFKAKAAMSVNDFKKIMEKSEKLSENEKFEALGIKWDDANLLRNPAFLHYIDHPSDRYMYIPAKVDLVYQKLMEAHRHNFAAVVKTLNAGRMDMKPRSRYWAKKVEDRMMGHWKVDFGFSAEAAFETLNLDAIENESELYGNPAFATWIEYVKRYCGGNWYKNIMDVLRKEENSKKFQTVVDGIHGLHTSNFNNWYKKMDYINNNYNSWHDLVGN